MDAAPPTLKLLEPAPPDSLLPDAGWWPWLLVAALAAVLVCVVGGVLMVRRRKAAAGGLAEIRKAAYDQAIAAFAQASARDARDAAVQASLILRRYLAAAAADPALYETHEEFVARHDALQALDAETRTIAATNFSRLAAMKYAPEIPAADPAAVLADAQKLLVTLHHGLAA